MLVASSHLRTNARPLVLDIRDDDFTFQIPNKEVAAKAALDSIYKEAHEASLKC